MENDDNPGGTQNTMSNTSSPSEKAVKTARKAKQQGELPQVVFVLSIDGAGHPLLRGLLQGAALQTGRTILPQGDVQQWLMDRSVSLLRDYLHSQREANRHVVLLLDETFPNHRGMGRQLVNCLSRLNECFGLIQQYGCYDIKFIANLLRPVASVKYILLDRPFPAAAAEQLRGDNGTEAHAALLAVYKSYLSQAVKQHLGSSDWVQVNAGDLLSLLVLEELFAFIGWHVDVQKLVAQGLRQDSLLDLPRLKDRRIGKADLALITKIAAASQAGWTTYNQSAHTLPLRSSATKGKP